MSYVFYFAAKIQVILGSINMADKEYSKERISLPYTPIIIY